MNTKLVMPLAALLLAGCAGSGPRPASTAPAPTPTPAATPAPVTEAGFPLTPEEKAEQQKQKEKVEHIANVLAGRKNEALAASPLGEGDIVSDPKTGARQQRIAKGTAGYLASGGRLYLGFVNDKVGVAILREDENYWYVGAPTKRTAKPKGVEESEQAMSRSIPMPAEDAEVVTPPRTTEKLVLAEMSEGLPKEGMWRENIDMADLDGDGKPEIVAPPPRLSGRQIQIFKWDGKKWFAPAVTFDDPERIGFEYGGVACGDLDGDGRIDIAYGRHGGGPAIAYNKGDFHFVIATKGLPKEMSLRALAIGDLNGDGHPDIVAVSDMPEAVDVRRAEGEGDASARLPRADGYIPGYDARAFLWDGGRYREVHAGLDGACYGYTMALHAPASDGLAPFYASSCRYSGLPFMVFTYDKATQAFAGISQNVPEAYALHVGTAAGTYQGHPAVAVTYSKATPQGGTPNISGYGVSIYYRDGSQWRRKRVVKVVQEAFLSEGVAMGDLDGDGLDDVVFADDAQGRLRVFLQRRDGSFEELAQELEPTYVNHVTSVRIADVDGDGRKDIVMSYQALTADPTRAGGLRVFRNRK